MTQQDLGKCRDCGSPEGVNDTGLDFMPYLCAACSQKYVDSVDRDIARLEARYPDPKDFNNALLGLIVGEVVENSNMSEESIVATINHDLLGKPSS